MKIKFHVIKWIYASENDFMENVYDNEFYFDIVRFIQTNQKYIIIILTLCHFDRHHWYKPMQSPSLVKSLSAWSPIELHHKIWRGEIFLIIDTEIKNPLKMASFGPGFWAFLQHYLPFKNPYSLTSFFLKKIFLFF